jgi:putative ABC transport system substrate-binding protein
LLALGLGTLWAALPSLAQQQAKVWRVGILAASSRPASLDTHYSYGSFLKGMRELGWIEGKNVSYETRWAEGKYERLPGLAAELVQSKPDVIVASTPPSIRAARQATATIPIVMVSVGDPVALGFVASFARPGANVTGVSNAVDDVSNKYLELLRSVIPRLKRVAVLVNPENPNYLKILGQIRAAAKIMAVDIATIEAKTPDQIAAGLGGPKRIRAQALIVQADGFFGSQWRHIAELALKHRMPTMFWTREPVEAGGLMSYGQNVADDYRKTASFVNRILKGASPRDLPVEQPTILKLTINRKTAQALGLTLPQELLFRADEVIE